MLETVFSEDFRGEQFPQFLQFLLEQFMYLETLFSYTLLQGVLAEVLTLRRGPAVRR